MKNFLITIATVLILMWIFYPNKEVWDGVFYPNGPDSLLTYERTDGFASLEACRSAMRNKLSSLGGGDYECGLNCKVAEYIPDMYICEDTFR